MTPADVRLTAQLVVDKRVPCVTDDSVMALARRVLELEGEVERWVIAANQYRFHQTTEAAVKAEREACALLVGDYVDLASGNRVRTDFAIAIRARGGK